MRLQNKNKCRHVLYALYKCMYQWQWMAVTGSNRKSIYFSQMVLGIYENIPRLECYCCQYSQDQHGNIECENCPLAGIAWRKTKRNESGFIAQCDRMVELDHRITPLYAAWRDITEDSSDVECIQIAAQNMVSACIAVIKHHELKRITKSRWWMK